jgi:hypothetical protein
MKKLANRAWSLYGRLHHNRIVCKPSFPILYFGDIVAYKKSKPRVVTVGLNPSRHEFDLDGERFKRFPTIKINLNPDIETYMQALNNYFRTGNAYTWFDSYDDVLGGLGTSYKKGAVHIDLFSPLGTTVGWGSLTKRQKSTLEHETSGVPLCQGMIRVLEPNVILASISEDYLTHLINESFPVDGQVIKWIKYPRSALVIHGAASRKPFGKLGENDRRAVGKKIREKYLAVR